jgi:hypothetical protein
VLVLLLSQDRTSGMPTANLNSAFARPSHCKKFVTGLLGTMPAQQSTISRGQNIGAKL